LLAYSNLTAFAISVGVLGIGVAGGQWPVPQRGSRPVRWAASRASTSPPSPGSQDHDDDNRSPLLHRQRPIRSPRRD